MPLVEKMFEKAGLEKPAGLTFETLAKEFMQLVSERYPTPDKVIQAAEHLGCREIEAKIIVISQMRDVIREVSPKYIYRSTQHRDELFLAIIQALEDLEDELEELTEENEESNALEEEASAVEDALEEEKVE